MVEAAKRSDLMELKEALLRIKCNFFFQPTLIGATVTIMADGVEVDFEFGCEGEFLRVITVNRKV